MEDKPFSPKARLRSFRYAFDGLGILLRYEHNARIHLVAAISVVILGAYLGIARSDWLAVIIVIGLVFAAEAVNSAIEYLANFVSPEHHELIKKVKDLAAASVLITAITAAIVGVIIFAPLLWAVFAHH